MVREGPIFGGLKRVPPVEEALGIQVVMPGRGGLCSLAT